MSDFSTITLSPDLPLIPKDLSLPTILEYQCKDLPDDEELSSCVDGEIDETGLFIRVDHRGRFYTPHFNWWVRLVPCFNGDEIYAEFRAGKVVKMQLSDKEYRSQRPDGIEDIWLPLPLSK